MKAYVAEWSPAWDAGLRTGDVLVSINGRKNPYPDLVESVSYTHLDVYKRQIPVQVRHGGRSNILGGRHSR